jgi:hypothetical protein
VSVLDGGDIGFDGGRKDSNCARVKPVIASQLGNANDNFAPDEAMPLAA